MPHACCGTVTKSFSYFLLVMFVGAGGLALFLNDGGALAGDLVPPGGRITSESDIRNLVENYSNLENCKIDEYHRFGFNGEQETELVVKYRVGEITSFTDVFSLADPEQPVRLYHGERFTDLVHCSYDGIGYLFTYANEGSGCFVSGTLFSWDGAGPLTVAYRLESLFQGTVVVADSQLVFSDDTRYLRLEKKPEGFDLVQFSYQVTYPDLGWNVHILEAVEVTEDSLAISLDGRAVAFIQTQSENIRGFSSRDTFRLGLNEEVVVIGGWGHFSPDDWRRRGGGLLTSFVPHRKGHMSLSVNLSYRAYYSINVMVTNPGFIR